MKPCAALVILLGLALAEPAPAEDAPVSTAMVHFADGSAVPLSGWSLSYEYVAWGKGQTPATAAPARVASHLIVLGKKSLPAVGVLTLGWRDLGDRKMVDAAALGGTALKLEAPDAKLLLPGDKRNVIVRGLDITGQGLTGTPRTFCLLSFSSLVECGGMDADRVVKVEFQP